MTKLLEKPLIHQESINRKVCEITLKNFNELRKYSNRKHEVAGIIIGHERGEKIIITHILVDSNSLNNSSPFGVIRKTKGLDEAFDEMVKDNELIDWIGEWHTHPRSACVPSLTDIGTIESLFNDESYNYPLNIILIISGSKCVKGWYVRRTIGKDEFIWTDIEFKIIKQEEIF